MKIAYFDCFSDASGDMLLGALMDSGLSVDHLKNELDKLQQGHFDLRHEKVVKKGIGGSKAVVCIDEGHHGQHYHHLADITEIVAASDLSPSVKNKSMRIFKRLAQAEAKVHRIPVEKFHFHEVGVMDFSLFPVQMKKNRPGTLVTVACAPEMVGQVSDYLMRETTTIGLRWRIDNRIKAKRVILPVRTPYGDVRIKIAGAGDTITNMAPEYEDCKRIAREKKVPLKEIMASARSVVLNQKLESFDDLRKSLEK